MKKVSGVILLTLLITVGVLAEGVRSFGMGGAFTAVANDTSAILANSAGLTQIKNISILGNLQLDLEDEENYQNILEYFLKENNITDPNDLTGIKTSFSTSASGMIGFATNRLGLVLTPSYIVTADRQTGKMVANQLISSNLALALPLTSIYHKLPNISFGANVKVHYAKSEEYLFNEMAVISKQSSISGQGMGLDFGILAKFGVLSLGVNVKDIYSNIVWEGENLDPMTLDPNLNLGLAFTLDKGKRILALDYGDINLNAPKKEGKLRVGFEQTIFWLLKVRGGAMLTPDEEGLKQPEYSAGLGVKIGPLAADLALRSKFFQKDMAANLGVSIQF